MCSQRASRGITQHLHSPSRQRNPTGPPLPHIAQRLLATFSITTPPPIHGKTRIIPPSHRGTPRTHSTWRRTRMLRASTPVSAAPLTLNTVVSRDSAPAPAPAPALAAVPPPVPRRITVQL
ncbi:hypothetical protein EXIGLDRAFT_434686 [Exidia glandulosa HHB12029]|uniref:Uncharacterized protein n=1 Tax=Exidia glandulosa HHB12029 TaxID=1314781 RepID=A0A165KF45_EXIGL|nr:hypothetical protein EXIGLDRAFT_434686 [Exidia glandulosa HHB12029]